MTRKRQLQRQRSSSWNKRLHNRENNLRDLKLTQELSIAAPGYLSVANARLLLAGGLLYKGSESNLQYVTTTAFLLLTYANYLNSNGGVAVSCGTSRVTEQNLISLAKTQVDYILGNNPRKMSYMVDFGENYPKHVHHRGSSLPSKHTQPQHISCNDGFQYLSSGSANPNTLVGAIVGGPDSHDSFSDDRNNYQQSEPATYINAPFVGAVAFFAGKSYV